MIIGKTFHSISLDEFVPMNTIIDILKIDVEGHESFVMEGAMNLFKENRIKMASIEMLNLNHDDAGNRLLNNFKKLTEYGYSLTTLNCPTNRGAKDTFTLSNFDEFISYANIKISSKWRCKDVLVTLN